MYLVHDDKTTCLCELGILLGGCFTRTLATQARHVKADEAYHRRALDRSVFDNQKTRIIINTASIVVLRQSPLQCRPDIAQDPHTVLIAPVLQNLFENA